jgi:hypothetical protein
MIRPILKTIAVGIVGALFGILLLWLTLPSDFLEQMPAQQSGLFDNGFARRWDGTCTGWTRGLAIFHVAGDFCCGMPT